MDEGHTWYNGSVWHKDWPHKIYIGQWPIFRGPVVLLNILKTVWWRDIIFEIVDQCDSKVGLIKQMWVSDLYFIVRWFCLISWRLFDGWWSYLIWHKDWPHQIYTGQWPIFHGPVILPYILKTIWWLIMDQHDTKIDLNICWSVTYISWSSDFA